MIDVAHLARTLKATSPSKGLLARPVVARGAETASPEVAQHGDAQWTQPLQASRPTKAPWALWPRASARS